MTLKTINIMKKLIFLLLLALPFFGFSQAAYLMEFTNPNGSKVVFNLNDVRSCVAEGTGSYLFTRTGSGKTQVQESPATIALNSCGNIILFTVYSPANQFNTTKEMGVNPNYVVGVVSNTSGNGVLKMVTPTENFTTTSTYDAAVAELSICVSGGGGGGSLQNTYVGFGDGLNQLDGEAGFTYDAESNRLAVDTVKTKRISSKSGQLEILDDTKFNDYPNTRNDSGVPVNVFTTSSAGVLESHAVGELASLFSDSTYRIPNTTAFASTAFMGRVQTGRIVETDGYYVAGDGGGARYLISGSGTADAIRVFAVAGGRFATLIGNADGGVNFRQVGALPSTTVSYANRIQTALTNYDFVYNYENVTWAITQTLFVKSNQRLVLGSKTKILRISATYFTLLATIGMKSSVGNTSNVVIDGGIWDFDDLTPGTSGDEYNLCAFVFKDITDWRITNLEILEANKYAIYPANFKNLVIDNIKFQTGADGIHALGPGDNITISNIHGYSGDDFVVVAGGDWTGLNLTDGGDISNITINNVKSNPTGTSGNLIALFPGNNGTRNNVFQNVSVNNVQGRSLAGCAVAIINYGTLGNPLTTATAGGVLKNVSISNIQAQALQPIINITVDSIYGLKVDGVYPSSDNGKIEISSGAAFGAGYIDKAVFSNIYTVGGNTLSCINITASGYVKELKIENMSAVAKAASNIIQNQSTRGSSEISLDNCIFSTSVSFVGGAGVFSSSAASDITITDCDFDFGGNGSAVVSTGVGSSIRFNNARLNTTFGVYDNTVASASATIYPNSYAFTGADQNIAAALGSGSVFTLQEGSVATNGYTRILSNYTIGTRFNQGHVFKFFNTTTGDLVISATSQTINGVSTFTLPGKTGIEMHKVSATAWECDAVTASIEGIGNIAQDSSGWERHPSLGLVKTRVNNDVVGLGRNTVDNTYRLSIFDKPIVHESTGGSNLFTRLRVAGANITIMGSGLFNGLAADDYLHYQYTGGYYLATGGNNQFSITSAGATTFRTLVGTGSRLVQANASGVVSATVSLKYPVRVQVVDGNTNVPGAGIQTYEVIRVPAAYNGYSISDVSYGVRTTGATGTAEMQIRKNGSGTAGVTWTAGQGVKDVTLTGVTVATGDIIDVEIVSNTMVTPQQGLWVTIFFTPN